MIPAPRSRRRASSSPTAARSRRASSAPAARWASRPSRCTPTRTPTLPYVARRRPRRAAAGAAPRRRRTWTRRQLLAAAHRTGADAVHPGYGFLAESADFARAVLAAGLVWVGPPPETIALMGSKVEAKRAAEAAGVPLAPSAEVVGDDDAAWAEAAAAGRIPVAGQGLRGWRRPRHAARRRAGASWSRPCARPGARPRRRSATGPCSSSATSRGARHVEVQVLGDEQGRVVHLFERECSIQRRHQKIVEEAPSPGTDPATLRAMCGRGRGARPRGRLRRPRARSSSSSSASDERQEFFFLEMNTRLQVEHPVTERMTLTDLVRLQLHGRAGAAARPGGRRLRHLAGGRARRGGGREDDAGTPWTAESLEPVEVEPPRRVVRGRGPAVRRGPGGRATCPRPDRCCSSSPATKGRSGGTSGSRPGRSSRRTSTPCSPRRSPRVAPGLRRWPASLTPCARPASTACGPTATSWSRSSSPSRSARAARRRTSSSCSPSWSRRGSRRGGRRPPRRRAAARGRPPAGRVPRCASPPPAGATSPPGATTPRTHDRTARTAEVDYCLGADGRRDRHGGRPSRTTCACTAATTATEPSRPWSTAYGAGCSSSAYPDHGGLVHVDGAGWSTVWRELPRFAEPDDDAAAGAPSTPVPGTVTAVEVAVGDRGGRGPDPRRAGGDEDGAPRGGRARGHRRPRCSSGWASPSTRTRCSSCSSRRPTMADRAGADRQLQRLLRRPPGGRARAGRGRPDRRAHRRLAGRADHADPGPAADEARRGQRLRAHVPHPDGAGARHLPRPRHPGRLQRRRPRPGRLCAAAVGELAGRLGLVPARSRTSRATTSCRAWPSCAGPRRSPTSTPASRSRSSGCRRSPPTPTSAGSASRPPSPPGPTSSSPAGSPTPRSSSARPRGGTAGTPRRPRRARRSGRRRARRSSAARRRPAATTRSSPRCPASSTSASRSPRSPPTASSSSPSTTGTGGLVTVGTVTAQLLYEIGGPAYANPDVTARFDTVRLAQVGPDRVAISGVRGEPPPATLKVAVNALGGFRNTASLVLTGLDVEAKADLRRARSSGPRSPAVARASRRSTCSSFGAGAVPPTAGSTRRRRSTPPRPSCASRSRPRPEAGRQGVHRPGRRARARLGPRDVPDGAAGRGHAVRRLLADHGRRRAGRPARRPGRRRRWPSSPAARPLGRRRPPFADASARSRRRSTPASGGVRAGSRRAARSSGHRWAGCSGRGRGTRAATPTSVSGRAPPTAYAWLAAVPHRRPRARAAARRPADLAVEVHRLPNLLAVNVVVHGLLGRGVAENACVDPQAKGLGEHLRAGRRPAGRRSLAGAAAAR